MIAVPNVPEWATDPFFTYTFVQRQAWLVFVFSFSRFHLQPVVQTLSHVLGTNFRFLEKAKHSNLEAGGSAFWFSETRFFLVFIEVEDSLFCHSQLPRDPSFLFFDSPAKGRL